LLAKLLAKMSVVKTNLIHKFFAFFLRQWVRIWSQEETIKFLTGTIEKINATVTNLWAEVADLKKQIHKQCAEIQELKYKLLKEEEQAHELRLNVKQYNFEHIEALQLMTKQINEKMETLKKSHTVEIRFLQSQRAGLDELCMDQTHQIEDLKYVLNFCNCGIIKAENGLA
jgi:chromosome segregation ATPase